MVLLPAGAMLGKAVYDKMSKNGAQVVHTSRMVSNSAFKENWRPRPRKRACNPFEKTEMINRIGGTGVRRLCTQAEEMPETRTDWIAVYRYPGIRGCQLLARAKFVQTLASIAYLPYATYEYSIGVTDLAWYYSTAVLAIAAPIVLAVFSRYINRLVGVIAISEDNEWVRIGYLTFWGRRKNKFLQIEDLLPITETGFNNNDRLVKLNWYEGGGDCLFLPTDKCEILDEERAQLLFGNATIFLQKEKTE